jgi:hypothetical protein
MAGLDPGPCERGVVDQAYLGEAAQNLLGHVVGYVFAAQRVGELGTRTR